MKKTSLTLLLPVAFMLSVLTVLGAYATFNVVQLRSTLMAEATQDLENVADRAARNIDEWFALTERNLVSAATSAAVENSIKQMSVMLRGLGDGKMDYLHKAYVNGNPYQGFDRENLYDAGDRTAYSSVHAKSHDFFRGLRREYGYYDMFLFDAEGTVLYTVVKEGDLGRNANSPDLAETGLGKVFKKAWAAEQGTAVFEDFAPYTYSAGVPAGFMATPVFNKQLQRIGVLAIQLPADILTKVMDDTSKASQIHTYLLLGRDGTYRMEDGGKHVLGTKPDISEQITRAIAGETGIETRTVNREGIPVLAAFHPVSALQSGWAVVVEINLSEVMQPVSTATFDALMAVALASIALLGIGVLMGRWLAKPLAALNEATSKITRREEVVVGYQTRRDEVGDIARGLSAFQKDRHQANLVRAEMLFKGQGFNTAATAMMIADAQGKLLYLNTAAKQLFLRKAEDFRREFPGFDPQSLEGRNIEMFHKNHGSVMQRLSVPNLPRFELDIVVGNETFGLGINAVDDEHGQRQGYVVSWAEVRAQRRTTSIVSAIENSQVILEMAPDGTIQAMNDIGLQTYGYRPEELIGQSVAKLFHAGDADARHVLERLSQRDSLSELQHRVTKSGKELWVVSSMNNIRNKAGKVVGIVAICADQTEETLRKQQAEAQSALQAAELQSVVTVLRDSLGGLAQGDLSGRLTKPFSPAYEPLRQNFNSAVESLNETLEHVATVAGNILLGANDIASAAGELSKRTESQAATLEETAAALDTLTGNVRSATQSTQRAGAKVGSAHAEARNNGGVVKQAIDAMAAIEASSQQISQIISVIDDIAFQTNLLALNAGVEAARAGDAGRGFAVVAAEVRALAQRSSEAAKEIKALISSSEMQVAQGAALVTRSGEAVEAIVADVAEISTIVNAISVSSQEQSHGLTEINAGVSLLDKVTQQNAAMVEESTAASQLLKQEAAQLSSLLEAFHLGAPSQARVSQDAA
jgi:methyl-accepting chemotaxis protein